MEWKIRESEETIKSKKKENFIYNKVASWKENLVFWKLNLSHLKNNEKMDKLYKFQRSLNNYLIGRWTRLYDTFHGPYIDYDQQGNFFIRWEAIHTLNDAKHINMKKELLHVNTFIEQIFKWSNKNTAKEIFQRLKDFLNVKENEVVKEQKKDKVRHAYIGKRPFFDFSELEDNIEDSWEKKYSTEDINRYNDIFGVIYNVLWDDRMKYFDIEKNKLSLNEKWKKHLITLFLRNVDRYNKSTLLHLNEVFGDWSEKSENDLSFYSVFKWDNILSQENIDEKTNSLNIEWITMIMDFLLMAGRHSWDEVYSLDAKVYNSKRLWNIYKEIPKKRKYKIRKIVAKINIPRLNKAYDKAGENIMSEKTKKNNTAKSRARFQETIIADEYLQQQIPYLNKVKELWDTLSKENLVSQKKKSKIEKKYGVSFSVNIRVKDMFSAIIKISRSADRTTLSDLLGIRVMYTTTWKSLSNKNKQNLFINIIYEIVWKINTYKEIFPDIDFPDQRKTTTKNVFDNKVESESAIANWLSEKWVECTVKTWNKTKWNTWSNNGYNDAKIYWWIFELQMQEISPPKKDEEISDVVATETEHAMHANLSKQKILEYILRKKTFFTLEDYLDVTRYSLIDHGEYMRKMLYKYKDDTTPIGKALYKKYQRESLYIIWEGSDKKEFDLSDILLPNKQWSAEVLRDIVLDLFNEEINKNRYLHYVYDTDTVRHRHIWLAASNSNEYEITTTNFPKIEDCLEIKNNSLKAKNNIYFTWPNFHNAVYSGHISTNSRIGFKKWNDLTYQKVPKLSYDSKIPDIDEYKKNKKKNKKKIKYSVISPKAPNINNFRYLGKSKFGYWNCV